jgi:hypothetical protein
VFEHGTSFGDDGGGIDRREAFTQPGEAFEQPLQGSRRVLGLAFGCTEAGAQEDPNLHRLWKDSALSTRSDTAVA